MFSAKLLAQQASPPQYLPEIIGKLVGSCALLPRELDSFRLTLSASFYRHDFLRFDNALPLAPSYLRGEANSARGRGLRRRLAFG